MQGPSGSPSPVPAGGVLSKEEGDINKPIDRAHADAVINFLIKLACQVRVTDFIPLSAWPLTGKTGNYV